MRVSLPQFRGNRRCTREDHNANDTRTDDPPNRKPAGTLGPLGYVNVGVKCWPWEQESRILPVLTPFRTAMNTPITLVIIRSPETYSFWNTGQGRVFRTPFTRR